MNRIKLLVVALVASGALLVSTGAVPLPGAGDAPGGDVVLAPADGPNGAYAMMNDEGKLELVLGKGNPNTDIEGVPPGVQTPIDEVFTVTYTGDQFAEVWFEDGAEDVRFYRGDDPSETLEGAANAVVLRPNETVAVGLFVDTRGDHDVAAASSFTVEVREGPPATSAPTTTRVTTTTTDRPATTTTTTSDRPTTTTDRSTTTTTDRPATTTTTTTTSDRPTTTTTTDRPTTTTTNRPTTTDRPGVTPDRSPTPQSTTSPPESDPPATETPTPPETDDGVETPTSDPPTPSETDTPTSEPPTPTAGRTTTDTGVTDRQGPGTATARDSPTAGPPPTEDDAGGQTGPIEAGGPVPTALLGAVVLVLVTLSGLAIYRYRD